jgi:hypothetical protein
MLLLLVGVIMEWRECKGMMRGNYDYLCGDVIVK